MASDRVSRLCYHLLATPAFLQKTALWSTTRSSETRPLILSLAVPSEHDILSSEGCRQGSLQQGIPTAKVVYNIGVRSYHHARAAKPHCNSSLHSSSSAICGVSWDLTCGVWRHLARMVGERQVCYLGFYAPDY